MLMIAHYDLSIIALIGVILLIGIVKKNGIMMVDFAISAERKDGETPLNAIRQACLLRFRPILMTTMAAMLGGLPLMLGSGAGSELRKPLGFAMVGGLLLSQVLTLYTTPVIYLYLDRLQRWLAPRRRSHMPRWRRRWAPPPTDRQAVPPAEMQKAPACAGAFPLPDGLAVRPEVSGQAIAPRRLPRSRRRTERSDNETLDHLLSVGFRRLRSWDRAAATARGEWTAGPAEARLPA